MGRVSGGRGKAMKGKDEESGLEKRQNREVGQRQATSVFCVLRDVPMYSCPICCRRSQGHRAIVILLLTPCPGTMMDTLSTFYYSTYGCRCIHGCLTCPHDHFIKSDTCQRICVDASANYHVNGVSLDFTSRCKYLFACRCQGWHPGIEPADKTGAFTDVQPLHLGGQSSIGNFTRPARCPRPQPCPYSQRTAGT